MREIDFSKYELRKFAIKFANAEAFRAADCVGTLEEEFEPRIISKMCRGIVMKQTVKGSTGVVTISMHVPYDIYCNMFDMGERDDLVKGVQGYGINNMHKEFSAVGELYNEDNELLLVAYPRCINATGPNTNIENGAEEVAEVEMEITIMPDENGYLRYECMPDDLEEANAEVATKWMTAFTPELVSATPTA